MSLSGGRGLLFVCNGVLFFCLFVLLFLNNNTEKEGWGH